MTARRGIETLAATLMWGATLFVSCAPSPRWPGVTDGCPEHMVAVEDAFCIDRWEAALVEEPSGRPHPPNVSVGGRRVRAVVGPDRVPQGYISRNEAAAACGAAGKRLCREHEWVRACRGPQRFTYPYGNREQRGVCNDDGVSPLLRLFAGTGTDPYSDRAMNDARLHDLPRTVLPSGTRRNCVSPYGAFDMVGNLHEWVDAPGGAFLGGYYLDTRLNGRGCSYKTTAHGPAYHDYSTGFRCCADRRP
jgi:formylglycine-generating enzyme required for sulfatase activity